MTVLLEGPDSVGKGTQITKIQQLLTDKPLQIMHYMAYKGLKDIVSTRSYSKEVYQQMFSILIDNYKSNNFILDRSHIGEVIYSPMYRGYDGEYVYELETLFKDINKDFWNSIYLITFIDKAENLIKRDDGLSFTTELEKKNAEITAFREATNKSNINHKLVLNIDGKDENAVFKEIKIFLGKS